ncbi:hypothetical protein LTR60_000551 [Cryomyces antarcticus]|nr:hypothetical protein LTR60_000551 [Cryomyces antarcticus]
MGHEAIGIVDEIGPEVKSVQKGDRVIISPVVACGYCFCCKRKVSNEHRGQSSPRKSQLTRVTRRRTRSATEPTRPRKRRACGILGYTQHTGGYPGNQAESCRVPNADIVLVRGPKPGISPEKLLALADFTTTAWHGCELAEVGKGDVVGVWGCDPVGLSIQNLSFCRGAKKVYAVDPHPQRLKIAERLGCESASARTSSRSVSCSASRTDLTKESRLAASEARRAGRAQL